LARDSTIALNQFFVFLKSMANKKFQGQGISGITRGRYMLTAETRRSSIPDDRFRKARQQKVFSSKSQCDGWNSATHIPNLKATKAG
jgi:hypothetical protein